nr:SemiSWEET transporter [Chthonobacter albigriseus]
MSVFGWIASVCSMISFVPQAWKVVRSGDVESLSLRMYAVTVTGFLFWTLYGLSSGEAPIIVTNAVCLVLSGFILLMKTLPEARRMAVARWITRALGRSGPDASPR